MRKREHIVSGSKSTEKTCCSDIMRRAIKQWHCRPRLLVPLLSLALIPLALLKLPIYHTDPKSVIRVSVDPVYREHVHSYVSEMLARKCRPSFARQRMEAEHSSSTPVTVPFLDKNTLLNEQIFKYPPPFGFLEMQNKLQEVLNLLPASSEERFGGRDCRRCVVIGNGGILKGLGLGPLLNQFNVIIRLNSGPVKDYSADVGNRTTIRISYPEGCQKVWEDSDPDLKFVAVIYKPVDFHWLRAMITKTTVSLWDWLFFWQQVPVKVPVELSQFRLLNPEVIRETALDLLHYPTPRQRLWGWDQNVPTLGVSALNLATYICDEVSLAGFGYNLSQKEAPLHYYDDLPMTAMLKEAMHDVQTERVLLKHLIASDTITDLTGGIHCNFCSR
ncbi:lactosylceramide alpha-2,3-sialyltransferase-like isoform X1 [Myxocyprinus asiaticus]|uniref:lactosylceramide alpha-2,3-sialyltransferase-like isoform X1 n=1 Tax=Myxocyprinus asiaticus TaxID=70543 RepID=UPI002221AEFD|nr:lactosylceramide alpha-2,3-sialyltransferase-like isoform X1 [Myxocyprinus asiaticus]XP_051514535.1 lactosylceramide alpha-2,3-sialyltransferase-like isoform X1 [Myxocyprinus asiaticus]XP_051514537.1 lactosylceramide alpha-2,3-sialyltransferase-like isoform X1 [Myxocyprinus asiaticus]